MLGQKAGRKSRRNRLGLTLSRVSLVCAAMVFALVAASCSDDDPVVVTGTSTSTYTVGGTVTGLTGTLALQNNC